MLEEVMERVAIVDYAEKLQLNLYLAETLEHRAEKWMPVFCKNDAKTNS